MRTAAVRRRRPPAWLGLLAVPVVLVAAVLPLRGAPRVHVTAYHGALPRFTTPAAYHISYAVTPAHGRGYTEELFVRRPFDSVDTYVRDGNAYLETVTRLGDQALRTGGATTVVHTALAPASRDARIGAVAADAIAAGRMRVVGRARVLGAECFVVRTAAPLNSGPLQVMSGSSHVDSCVDRRGLVLDEWTTSGGRRSGERRAARVVTGRAAATKDFALTGEYVPPQSGGGAVRALTLVSRPSSGPFWDIARAPAGYVHTGRYAVVPSQPQAWEDRSSFTATGFPGSLVASIDDVYVRGADAIVIEQGSTVNDAKFSPPDGGIPVDLGAVLGRGQILLAASANEVVAEPHEGRRFVRVIGTVPARELIAIARSMTLQPPGALRPRSAS